MSTNEKGRPGTAAPTQSQSTNNCILAEHARVRLPFMPWYPSDFYGATRGWPLVARAVYRELIDSQWDQGGLSVSMSDLRQICGATAAEWRKAWPPVAAKFPIDADGYRRNARLEQHRAKAIALHTARKAGADTTNAKLGRGRSATRSATPNNNAERHAERLKPETLSDTHPEPEPKPSLRQANQAGDSRKRDKVSGAGALP